MNQRVGLLVVFFALGLAGCGNGDSADSDPEADSASITACPNEEDRRVAIYDLGPNPDGENTPEAAVEVFLRRKGGDATLEDFSPVNATQNESKVNFVYSDGEFKLARLYVEQFERGWIVVSYEYCQGAI